MAEIPTAFYEVLQAIDLCREKRLIASTLILVFTMIDSLASLSRPKEVSEVRGRDFIDWVDKYLLPESDISCSATDLYAARCSLVHSLSTESRLSRKGETKTIMYSWGAASENDLQDIIDDSEKSDDNFIAIHADKLIMSLTEALGRFGKALLDDKELDKLVEERLIKTLTNITATVSRDESGNLIYRELG